MSRPPEYENLIKTKALETVAPTPGAVARYLQNASDYLATAKAANPQQSLQVFTLAYEAYFQLVQAVLPEFVLITKAHARRNSTSYQSPFPPVSMAEAATLVSILEKYIPVAYKLANVPYP